MKNNESNGWKDTRAVAAGADRRPPCLGKTPSQCRGCFGWDRMLEAAKSGGAWSNSLIRCDCTGLTLRLGGEKRNEE